MSFLHKKATTCAKSVHGNLTWDWLLSDRVWHLNFGDLSEGPRLHDHCRFRNNWSFGLRPCRESYSLRLVSVAARRRSTEVVEGWSYWTSSLLYPVWDLVWVRSPWRGSRLRLPGSWCHYSASGSPKGSDKPPRFARRVLSLYGPLSSVSRSYCPCGPLHFGAEYAGRGRQRRCWVYALAPCAMVYIIAVGYPLMVILSSNLQIVSCDLGSLS